MSTESQRKPPGPWHLLSCSVLHGLHSHGCLQVYSSFSSCSPSLHSTQRRSSRKRKRPYGRSSASSLILSTSGHGYPSRERQAGSVVGTLGPNVHGPGQQAELVYCGTRQRLVIMTASCSCHGGCVIYRTKVQGMYLNLNEDSPPPPGPYYQISSPLNIILEACCLGPFTVCVFMADG